MAQENGTFKKIGRQVWDLFKGAFLTSLMFMSAGALLVVICFKGETSELQWTNAKMIWTIVCVVCAWRCYIICN